MIKSKIHINNFLFLCITALILIFNPTSILSNNVSISNVSLVEQDVSAGANNAANFAIIQFDISWNNSWRTSSAPNNWDAVWVFAKYRVGSGAWTHCYLNNTGHTAPTGSTIDVGLVTPGSAFHATTNPGVGVFIYRNADGSGTFSLTDVEIRWNYGANGLLDNDSTEIEIYGFEMVYIPSGSFYVGGNNSNGGLYQYPTTTSSYQITGEAAITVGTTAGNLYYDLNAAGGHNGDRSGPIPDDYPKGYNAIYYMKYELSQSQYVDFLNSLNYTQQAARTTNAPTSAAGTAALTNARRNGIDIKTSGVNATTPAVYACNLDGDANYDEANDGHDITCNYLSWDDLLAYLDWSGLRPISEFEFEKICRGPGAPVSGEYAWGTTSVKSTASAYTVGNQGEDDEDISANYETTAGFGNAIYSGVNPGGGATFGPLRGGIFAAHASNSGRETSGASYYGVMEMSGNIWERPVTFGNATGRAFTGLHGDGAIAASGLANSTNWPTGAGTGSGLRGGTFQTGVTQIRVTDRYYCVSNSNARADWSGGRGGRTAP